MIHSNKWITYYLGMAKQAATGSKDGSKQVGAVIVRKDNSIVSTGFNGFPKAIEDKKSYLNDTMYREHKLARMVHAEANALDFAHEDLTGAAIFVTIHPCSACALRIINRGITKVYYLYDKDFEARWKESLEIAQQLFREAGVKMHHVNI